MSQVYTILTTAPPYGSQNIGDKLIEQRTKELIIKEKGKVRFFTIFREESLEPFLDKINSTRAIIMPAFPIRDNPMYPGVYRLVKDLSKIKVPMIPLGANWNVYPGDRESLHLLSYSKATLDFISYVYSQVSVISCREYFTCEVLKKFNFNKTIMTGDPAMFFLPSIGKPMHRPQKIHRLVFTPPLSAYYLDQAKAVITMLANNFSEAEITCAFLLFDANSYKGVKAKSENSAALSPEVTAKNEAIRKHALSLGFKVMEMAGDDVKGLEFYQSFDLHVGYDTHAHLYFLSRRIPSLLIAEDARGVGFNHTLGVGGVEGFKRAQCEFEFKSKKITSGYCTTLSELAIAPPKTNIHLEIEEYLSQELKSGFRRYIGLPDYLNDLYENTMRPFIQSLP